MGAAPALTRIRHELIRAELARCGGVRIRDLVSRLGVSRATVRRDLYALIDAGEAVNARGGALLPADRAHGAATLERGALAEAAAADVEEYEVKVLGLFGGASIHELARILAERAHLRVVTNSLATARILADAPQSRGGPQVTLLGGSLHPSGAMLGSLATGTLAGLRLDAAYFDCAGFDPRTGATVDDLSEAELRRVCVAASDRPVLLVERDRVGVCALGTFAAPGELAAVLGPREVFETLRAPR